MDELLKARSGETLTLTLNRPDKMNALSAALVDALLDAVGEAAGDGTRLLVLEDRGPVVLLAPVFEEENEAVHGRLPRDLLHGVLVQAVELLDLDTVHAESADELREHPGVRFNRAP